MSLARTRDFLELIKFSHTLFALPFALLGAVLAACYPRRTAARLAGLARHPALHGRGALGRDGLQPPGRPPYDALIPGPPAGTSPPAG